MRSRPLAAVAAAFVLALSAAACGGGDDEQASTPPTSGDIVPPSQPVQAGASTPADDAGGTDPSGDADASGTPAEPSGERGSGGKGNTDAERPQRRPSGELIPAVALASSDLTNFSTAVGAADLDATLDGPGPFTVFAPNNDGFAKLGTRLDALLQPAAKAELVNILSFHVIKGEFKADDLKDGKLLTTVQGTRVRVSRKGDTITLGNSLGDATVTSSDLVAGNGVIHVIDTVLAPKTK